MGWMGSAVDLLIEEGDEFVFREAALFAAVAVAECDGAVFFDGVEVNGNAEGGADFVLAAVAATDGSGGVVEDVPAFLQTFVEGAGALDEFGLVFQKWEDGGFVRRDAWVELEECTFFRFAFVVGDFVFGVGGGEDGEESAVNAEGGLNHMGDVLRFGGFVEDLHGLAGVFLVLVEVVIRAAGDAPEFLFSVGEVEHEIGGGAGVEGELVLGVYVFGDRLAREADGNQPVDAGVEPLAMEALPVGFRGDEVLDLHLLELAGAEDKVARGDLVAEGFADLGDTKGDLDPSGIDDVFIVGEDALGGLGAKVGRGGVIGEGADFSFKHELELAWLSQGTGGRGVGAEGLLALFGAGFGGFDGAGQLCLVEGGLFAVEEVAEFLGAFDLLGSAGAFDECDIADGFPVEDNRVEEELVGAVAELGLLAVDHRIGKTVDVPGGFPNGGVHDDAGVKTFDVVPPLDKVAPPGLLDIVAQFDAEWAIVEKAVIAAIDF